MRSRRVWRAAPASLVIVVLFALTAGLGVPALAVLLYARDGQPAVPILLGVLALAAVLYAWRFGLHPKLRADERGITVVNPRRRQTFAWEDITVIASGADGLVVASERARAEAWCVQKSNWATRRGRRTRSDAIVEQLEDLRDTYDPPLTDDETGIRIRRARSSEARLLTRLERAANETALGHIFSPAEHPYPTAAVERRWRRMLRNRLVQVRVLELLDTPVGFVAYETSGKLRHLGVASPQVRRGFGSLLLEYACEEIFDSGTPQAELWVLVDNTGARAFYRSHGWLETDDVEDSEYPPYPRQLRMVRRNPAAPRRRA